MSGRWRSLCSVLLPLVLLFIAVPIIEIYLLLQVGHLIGLLPTIALLLADSILGGMLMRSQGRAAWRRFNAALVEGRPPAREVIDGALVIFGGALLLTPGFFTDIFGVAFLLPPTRALIRAQLVRHFSSRVMSAAGAHMSGAGFSGPSRDPRFDVEGDATEIHPRRGQP